MLAAEPDAGPVGLALLAALVEQRQAVATALAAAHSRAAAAAQRRADLLAAQRAMAAAAAAVELADYTLVRAAPVSRCPLTGPPP